MGLLEGSKFHGSHLRLSSTRKFKPAISTVLTELPSWLCRRRRYCQRVPPKLIHNLIGAFKVGGKRFLTQSAAPPYRRRGLRATLIQTPLR